MNRSHHNPPPLNTGSTPGDGEQLALFPLHTVLFPGCALELQIFEQRYLQLVRQCLRENTGFVVVLIESGKEVGDTPKIFRLGTKVFISDWRTLENGLLGITVTATQRVRIGSPRARDDGLLTANVRPLPDASPDAQLLQEYSELRDTLKALLAHPLHQRLAVDLDNSVAVFNALAWLLPIHAQAKQHLLEIHDQRELCRQLRAAIVQLQNHGAALV